MCTAVPTLHLPNCQRKRPHAALFRAEPLTEQPSVPPPSQKRRLAELCTRSASASGGPLAGCPRTLSQTVQAEPEPPRAFLEAFNRTRGGLHSAELLERFGVVAPGNAGAVRASAAALRARPIPQHAVLMESSLRRPRSVAVPAALRGIFGLNHLETSKTDMPAAQSRRLKDLCRRVIAEDTRGR